MNKLAIFSLIGLPDSWLLHLPDKNRSWISWAGSDLSCFFGKFKMLITGSVMCSECDNKALENHSRFNCQNCGRVYCNKCMEGYISPSMGGVKRETDGRKQIKSCNFCSRGCNRLGDKRSSKKIYPSASPEGSPEPSSPCNLSVLAQSYPMTDFLDGYSPNTATSRSFRTSTDQPSPLSLHSSPTRSDGEEIGYSEKHFFRPSSEYCSDISDLDARSFSARHDFYSFKSVDSSPSDSPTSINFTCRFGHSVQKEHSDGQSKEIKVFLKRPDDGIYNPENEDDCSDELLIFRNQFGHLQKPLDFEKNGLIWCPPPPDDENDDVEGNYFIYDDEDDDMGEPNAVFSSTSSFSSVLPASEKHNEVNQGPLRDVLQDHFRSLVLQLLQEEDIYPDRENSVEEWLNIITTLAWEAANFVKPDTSKGSSMDPGDYVKVKCIASGNPIDSTLVKGVVCTKNIKHKRMTSQYKKPRVILLGGALEYQRIPNQLASFDTLLQQEIDHLKMIVSKIEDRRPNVLLVEKSVSSYAQDYLLEKEISLVLNVKRPLLERIARCTGGHIAPSTDSISSTRVGNCGLFRVERVSEELETSNQFNKRPSKTLMFFEGCPRHLGCTVLLKGACREELKKVKHVVQYAVFAAYHLSLETSFLADEGASLPKATLKPSISVPEQKAANNETSIISNFSIATSSEAVADFLPQSEDPEDANSEPGVLELSSKQFNMARSSSFCILSDCRIEDAPSAGPRFDLESKPEFLEAMVEEGNLGEEVVEQIKSERVVENEVSSEYFSSTDSHKSILVAFSSHCLNGTVCERSRLLRIKFYGCFDKPLGRYLCDDLFDQTSNCPYCNELVETHVRCYTHQQGILTINVRRLTSSNLPGGQDGKIWMWHRCLKCAPSAGIPPATRRVVMSKAARGLSFGKFLELSFSNHATANRIAGCGHSLQRDCLRYYGFGSMVAVFRYSPIDILSVHLPPAVLEFNGSAQFERMKNEAGELMRKTEILYMEVSDALDRIEQKFEPSDASDSFKCIMVFKNLLEKERNEYVGLLQSAGIETMQSGQMTVDFLELNRFRHSLVIGSCVWNQRLHLVDSLFSPKNFLSRVVADAYQAELKDLTGDLYFKDGKLECDHEGCFSSSSKSQESPSPTKNLLLGKEPNLLLVEPLVTDHSMLTTVHFNRQEKINLIGDVILDKASVGSVTSPESNLSDKIDSVWTGTDQQPEKSQNVYTGQSCGTQIAHIDSPPFKRVVSPVRVYSFDSAVRVEEKIQIGLSPSSMRLSNVRSFHASGDYRHMIRDPVSKMLTTSFSSLSLKGKKLSNMISSTPTYISCASQMAEGARLLLPQTGHNNLVIAVYDDEPGSIISYALSSKEYEDWVGVQTNAHDKSWNAGNEFKKDPPASTSAAWQPTSSLDLDYIHYGSYGSDDLTLSLGTLFTKPKKSQHLRISFEDDSLITDGKVKFSVTIYFAKEFDAIRRKCCPSEVDFIRSLSRCKKWRAEGGKSKVYFARSLDERFIIKQVTKTELDSFEKFAPEYFKYLTDSLSSKSPSCLAKVLGIYQVSVEDLKGGMKTKMDLMVMENLFFKRSISRVYDLKGSVRSRYNQDKTGENKVLLDTNLLEALRTKPIFVGSKAKRSLERAVWNDTSFLASVDVMDYSLLVGVDEESKELVLGIIDFMRQYTWDKHLETWVKASGILGGPRNASPTIVSPHQYKRRFRKAMTSYFLTIPDQLSS